MTPIPDFAGQPMRPYMSHEERERLIERLMPLVWVIDATPDDKKLRQYGVKDSSTRPGQWRWSLYLMEEPADRYVAVVQTDWPVDADTAGMAMMRARSLAMQEGEGR